MKESSEIRKHVSGHESSWKFRFPKRLVEVWQDFQDDEHWKHEELPPFNYQRAKERLRLVLFWLKVLVHNSHCSTYTKYPTKLKLHIYEAHTPPMQF